MAIMAHSSACFRASASVAAGYTGLRMRSELLTLRWENVDLARKTLTIIGAYAKNGRVRVVPLNSLVYDALSRLPTRNGCLQRLAASRINRYAGSPPRARRRDSRASPRTPCGIRLRFGYWRTE